MVVVCGDVCDAVDGGVRGGKGSGKVKYSICSCFGVLISDVQMYEWMLYVMLCVVLLCVKVYVIVV